MNKAGPILALLAAVGVGWLLASMSGASGSNDVASTDAEVLRLQDEVTRLRMALGERGPTLEEMGGLGTRPTPGTQTPDVEPDNPAPLGDVDTFDIQSFDDSDKAFRTLLAYVRTMLARGEAGHLALLETLDTNLFAKEGEARMRMLLGTEERAVRYLYPVIRFAMNHDAQVVDLTETVFRTIAENPDRVREMDADTLQIFTEGVAYMLPGMVGPKRLERFGAYGRAILAEPEDRQPRCVQRVRRDIQRAMASWAAPISPEEAFLRLQNGDVLPEEALTLLSRLDPADVGRLDLDALVGPLVERDPFRVLSTLARLHVDAGTQAKLDTRLIQSVSEGKLPQTVVQWWLRSSKRLAWSKAREFIEQGLRQSPPEAAGVFLLTALSLRPPPDEDWITWAERTYDYSDRVRVELQRRREGGK